MCYCVLEKKYRMLSCHIVCRLWINWQKFILKFAVNIDIMSVVSSFLYTKTLMFFFF